MPIHDWTRVDAGIFHHFHHEWISSLSRALNGGLLPAEYYALDKQIAGRTGLDEVDRYAAKAKAVVIRHTRDHQVVAVLEVVLPGNKNSQNGLRAFVRKAREAMQGGIHLLIVDLFPAGPRDPEGIHRAIWEEREGDELTFSPDRPLTAVAYIGGLFPEAFIEPLAVGDPLPEMPLFLTPEVYVPVPLEATYQSAWEAVPAFWRDVLTGASAP